MLTVVRTAALLSLGLSLVLPLRLLGQRGQALPSRPTTPTTAPAPQPPVPATGVILGQVVDARDGLPLGGAIVSLTGGAAPAPATITSRGFPVAPAPPPRPRRVLADAEGRFMFFALGPGSYEVSATAPGYMTGWYRESAGGGTSSPVLLKDGQKNKTISLALRRFAAITGLVLDDIGEPAIGVKVLSLKRQAVGGSASLVPDAWALTDDRGIYRLRELSPGDYLVVVPTATTTMPASVIETYQQVAITGIAGPREQFLAQTLNSVGLAEPNTGGVKIGSAYFQDGSAGDTRPPQDTGGPLTLYETAFFPGVPTTAQATAVTVHAGDEHTNVDFQRRLVRGFKVSGTIVGDAPAGPLPVRLLPANVDEFQGDAGLEAAVTISEANGTFTFLGVPPGAYVLKVLRLPQTAPTTAMAFNVSFSRDGSIIVQRPAPPTQPTLWAELAVPVGDTDLTGLIVPLRSGGRVSGRVEFDGASTKPVFGGTQITINLAAGSNRQVGGQIVPPIVGSSGQFTTMSLPPGKYLVSANASGWLLKSAMLRGRDVSTVPFDVEGTDLGGLVITLFDRPAQLSGTVRTARGNADETSTVILLPADFGAISSSLRTTHVAADGRYIFSGLRPGEYLVGAFPDALVDDLSDIAKLLETITRGSMRITIGDGDRHSQDLSVK